MHSHTRRGFLAQTLGAGYLGASLMEQAFFRATLARAQAPGAPTNLFDIRKVADGVYAALARPAALVNCNAAIFENANDLLVVDTHSKPSAAAALVAQIRRDVTLKPVRYVVESHFHWDHTQGAHAYREHAPNAQIISSTATRGLIAEFGAARLKASLEGLPAAIDKFEQQMSAAKSGDEKAYFQRLIAETRAYMAEMRGYRPEMPDMTFDEDLVLHDKAHELHLAFRGRGHTAGDVVVLCPEAKVLATGDLLHSWFPFIADGYPREWPRTLRTVAGFDFAHVIGGHGGVQDSKERLGQFAGYIEELTEAVAAAKGKGQTLEQVQASIAPATLKSLAGGYGEFVSDQIVHTDGQQTFAKPADVIAGNVRSNIADIWQRL
jgi:glyoxylase-like metal-dependent hydrolase (beta-lactamase superfamily II)